MIISYKQNKKFARNEKSINGLAVDSICIIAYYSNLNWDTTILKE